jgi:chromosome segregation ATPase
MSDLQFLFAAISAGGAVVAAAWIIAQSLSRARTSTEEFQERMVKAIAGAVTAVAADRKVPEYESRFIEGDRRMDEISRQIEAILAEARQAGKDLAVQVHSVNNLKMRYDGLELALRELREKLDEMPDRIVTLLRMGRNSNDHQKRG